VSKIRRNVMPKYVDGLASGILAPLAHERAGYRKRSASEGGSHGWRKIRHLRWQSPDADPWEEAVWYDRNPALDDFRLIDEMRMSVRLLGVSISSGVSRSRAAALLVCDHIEPHRGQHERFWHGPFQTLCKPWHDGDRQRIERASSGRYQDYRS